MKIHVQIDRLVLDGLPIDRRSAPTIQAAVEAELSRLFGAAGGSPKLLSGGSVPVIRTSAVHIDSRSSPGTIGHKVATAIHGGLQQ